MSDFTTIQGPENDNVVLEVLDTGVTINRWVEYSFNSNFLIPTDAFSFTVAGAQIDTRNRAALVPGANVRCTVNGAVQIDALIDSITWRVSRQGGVEMVISGRDKMASLIDSGINPLLKFNPNMTMLQFLSEVFAPFGYGESAFIISNEDNVAVMSRNDRGTKTRQSNTGKGGKPLKSFQIHQLRPYPNEGAFAFATRVCQREGLWLWLSADGKNIIASKPNYDQPAIFHLKRQFDGFNNIEDGDISFDVSEQPSIIIADGFSGGYNFGKSRIRAYIENPLLDVDNSKVLKDYAKAGMQKVTIPFFGKKIKLPHARPMFLHDDEAKTMTQLTNYCLREMSLRLRRGLSTHLSVKGHNQGGSNWTVDRVCSINDEVTGLNEDMYILARTFLKSRSGGTETNIELIRKNSLTF